MANQKSLLIYDGDCAFCSSTIRIIEKYVKNHPEIAPYQWAKLKEYGLTIEECQKEIKFVSTDGNITTGARAFSRFFSACPTPWKLIGKLLSAPIISQIARKVYNWIAKNRYRLPGGTPTCGI